MKFTVSNIKKVEIDWNQKQLVCSKHRGGINDYVIQTNGGHKEHTFEGTDLTTGVFSAHWYKEECKLFSGTITLQND